MYGHCSSFPFLARALRAGGPSPPKNGISGTLITKVCPQPLAAKSNAIHSSARVLDRIPYLGALAGRRAVAGPDPHLIGRRPPPFERFRRGPDSPVAFARTPGR